MRSPLTINQKKKLNFAEFLRLPGNRRPVTDCLREFSFRSLIINPHHDCQELPNCNWLEQKIKQCGNTTPTAKPRKRCHNWHCLCKSFKTNLLPDRATCSAAILKKKVSWWTRWSATESRTTSFENRTTWSDRAESRKTWSTPAVENLKIRENQTIPVISPPEESLTIRCLSMESLTIWTNERLTRMTRLKR